MTLSTAPAPVTTPTGAPLPLVALPQRELLTVNSRDIPMIKDALGPGRKWGTYDGGDHSIFIGQVLDHGSQEQGDVSPLIFHHSQCWDLGAKLSRGNDAQQA